MSLIEQWRTRTREHLGGATELRHHIHANPRISGAEEDTAELVAEAIGCGPGKLVAMTGRLIDIPTTAATGLDQVLLRAELDALPIIEATNVAWMSTNGAMHACGHDIHLAALTAVARGAEGLDLPAPLAVLLQPREESLGSGAADTVAENGLKQVAAVIAAHVQPQLEAQTIAVTSGSVNAGICEFTLRVEGRGGHAGYPHTVVDPVLALAAIVTSTQQVSARRVDPITGSVVMVTQLEAGSAPNVVPDTARARGTLRFMTAADESLMQKALHEIVTHTAASYGCTASITFDVSEPALVNDRVLADRCAAILRSAGRNVNREWRSFGSDDFAHFCGVRPSLMIFVGTGLCGGGLHDKGYLPSDSYIELVAESLIAGYFAALHLESVKSEYEDTGAQ